MTLGIDLYIDQKNDGFRNLKMLCLRSRTGIHSASSVRHQKNCDTFSITLLCMESIFRQVVLIPLKKFT